MTESAATTAPLPRFALGEGTAAFEAAVEQARSEDWATRLFDRDTTLWSTDPRVQEAISQRLGWLDAPEIREQDRRPRGLRRRDRRVGLRDRRHRRHGRQQPRAGRAPPDVRLDRGLPGAARPRFDGSRTFVAATLDDLDPLTHALHRRLQVRHDDRTERVPRRRVGAEPRLAIHHRRLARTHRVSCSWRSPTRASRSTRSTIGHDARGLPQPARHRRPLLGADVLRARPRVAHRARPRRAAGSAHRDGRRMPRAGCAVNPGVSLGLALGTLANNGRDKLTFLVDDEIASLGAWLEQLIAESTGKRGVGIVPVDGEPLGAADGVRRGPGVRPHRARRRHRRRAATTLADRARGRRPSGDPDRHQRSDRPRRRVLPLGGRHRDRRRRARHRPIRPAERRRGQGADATCEPSDRRPGRQDTARLVRCAPSRSSRARASGPRRR